ncbi:type II CAAX prenyl endopeptidase Rce1 family protein [Maribacter litopenaei]|uniref:CPBP family glutamic-type intramembrane protease n=1 Tax=Maribacter litopenaei TaxID=2976127 RepID=UPI0030840776
MEIYSGLFVVFGAWQIFGGIPLVIALFVSDAAGILATGDMGSMSEALGSNTFLFFMLLTFAIGLLCLLLYVKFVHKQSIKSLTTSRKSVDWSRILFSFSLWAIVSIALLFLDIWLTPEDYSFNFKLEPFLILAAVSIVFIPIQTSMEEYFMRGYMMQGLGIMTKNRWFPLFFTSLLFGLMHILNPK